jgi:signal transduction histidine kinase/ligand-binding sensor domain-containing protein
MDFRGDLSLFGKILLLVLALFSWVVPVAGQVADFKPFDRIDGLPQSYVYALQQDAQGYLWIGTGEGLALFDGLHFQKWSEADGLAEDFVTALHQDRQGRMWIGHFQGMVTLANPLSRNMEPYAPSPENLSRINQFYEDQENTVWAVTQHSGLVAISAEGHSTPMPLPQGVQLYAMEQDGEGKYWLATNKGLVPFFPNQGPLMQAAFRTGQTFLKLIRTENMLYALSDEGVFVKRRGAAWEPVDLPDTGKAFYTSFFLPNPDEIWLGTRNQGVWVYRKDSRKGWFTYKHFQTTPHAGMPLAHTFLQDREKNLWIGTYGQGLLQCLDQKFSVAAKLPPGKEVSGFVQDPDGLFWVGTQQGAYLLDASRQPSQLQLVPALEGLPISSLAFSTDGSLWIGSDGQGLFQYQPEKRKLIPMNQVLGLSANFIQAITFDQTGNLWIGTRFHGLNQWDPQKELLTQYATAQGYRHNVVNDVFCDSRNRVWAVSPGLGIGYFLQGEFVNCQAMADVEVNCLTEDQRGNIWFGTNGKGIIRWNNQETLALNVQDGLPSNYVYMLGVDLNNQIWIGTRSNLARYDVSRGAFLYEHSLASQISFQKNHYQLDQRGNAWFGVRQGVLRYDPQEELLNTAEPMVHLQSFLVFDDPYPLEGPVKLPYAKYRLTFGFQGISLKSPENVQYQYKLLGFDDDWSSQTTENRVRYAKILEGEYALVVRAMNADGFWSAPQTLISFTVATPFWKTYWFYVLAAMATFGLVYGYNQYRLKSLKDQNARLELEVNRRTEQLHQQYLQLEKLNVALDEQKNAIEDAYKRLVALEEFKESMTNMIVHDLKNPLNTVISLADDRPRIQQCARQMLNMVANILDISKFEESALALQPIPVTVRDLFKQAFQETEILFQDKGVLVQFEEGLSLTVSVDRLLVIRVLVNLVSNAVKFTPPNGTVTLTARELLQQGMVQLAVKDTGIGIDPSKHHLLFLKFSQLEERDLGKARSTGLGLAFCRMAVEAHGGKIWIDSAPGKGSVFYFTLPTSLLPVYSDSHEPLSMEVPAGKPVFQLVSEDLEVLAPLAFTLENMDVYDIGAITKVVESFTPGSQQQQEWLNAVSNAAYSFNAVLYKDLINLCIENHEK